MEISAEYQMSRAEAWRGAVIPRHWVVLLVLVAVLVVGRVFVFTSGQAAVENTFLGLFFMVQAVGPAVFRAEGWKSFAVPTTVTLTDSEMTVVRPNETTVATWASVGSLWRNGRDAWVVRKNWRTVAILPRRAFDAAECAAIDRLLKQVEEDNRQRYRRPRTPKARD